MRTVVSGEKMWDEERAFTYRDEEGLHYLAIWNDITPEGDAWYHLPLSPARYHDLCSERVSLRKALKNLEYHYAFVVTFPFNGEEPVSTVESAHKLNTSIMI